MSALRHAVVSATRVRVYISGERGVRQELVDQQPSPVQASRAQSVDARTRVEGRRRRRRRRHDPQLHGPRQLLRRPTNLDGRPRTTNRRRRRQDHHVAGQGTRCRDVIVIVYYAKAAHRIHNTGRNILIKSINESYAYWAHSMGP